MNGIEQAKIAIRAGHLSEARRLLQRLVRDEPQNHKAWLLLARVTSSPRAAREYVLYAQTLQPTSALVQRELKRLDEKQLTEAGPARRPSWRTYFVLGSSLVALLLLLLWLAPLGWEHALALRESPDFETVFAPATVTPWPTREKATLVATQEPTLQPTPNLIAGSDQVVPTAEPEVEQVLASVVVAGDIDVTPVFNPGLFIAPIAGPEIALVEPQPDEGTTEIENIENVEEPASLSNDTVPAVESSGIRPSGVGPGERWIDVNLNTQSLVAYEGDTPVFNSLISSGMWDTPTVIGQFRTNMKYERQDMNGYLLGYDYYLEDVPYVMYFFEDYAIHGTYWHNNFGTPMSHGCVNMDPSDAGWLFNWAPVGTTVNIHN